MGRKIVRIAGWMLVLLGLTGGFVYYRKVEEAKAQSAPKFKTMKVERGTVAAKVTATGTLSARITVLVGSQVSGRVQDVFVDFNSPVKKGQVLAKIDPRVLQAALQKARASYAEATASVQTAKANAAQAERAFARAKELKAQGLLGQADYETSETAVTSTKADVEVAQGRLAAASATLNEAQVNLGFTTLVSPIDGIVLSRSVDVGQTVAASLQSPTLFTLAQDLRSIQVDTFVAEADVGKLQAGMDATFTVDAYPGHKFHGKVREVRNAAQTVQNVVTYDAVLDVPNDELKLRPGMTANVTFVWAKRDEVLKVPNAALRFKPSPEMLAGPAPSGGEGKGKWGGKGGGPSGESAPSSSAASAGSAGSTGPGAASPDAKTVWVLRDGAPRPRKVVTGITDGTVTEIVSGEVREGDELITEALATGAAAGGAPTGANPFAPGGGGAGGRKRGGM